MREYTYQIDEDGVIWHEGSFFDEPEIYVLFHRGMRRAGDGRLYAVCQGEKCWIDPVDTPFVVDMVKVVLAKGSGPADSSRERSFDVAGITLVLKGGVEEPLDPATLSVGARNVLYTMVREGQFPARFSRKAYYELARYIVPSEDGEEFALHVGGRPYPISGELADAP